MVGLGLVLVGLIFCCVSVFCCCLVFKIEGTFMAIASLGVSSTVCCQISGGYNFVLFLDLASICTELMTESWNIPMLGKFVAFNRDKVTIVR